MENERVYVLSDLHLNLLSPEKRYSLLGFFKKVVSKDATAVYLNGDIVDLMEPEMSDQAMQDIRLLFFLLTSMAEGGIPVHYNLGNHDLPLLLLFPDFKIQNNNYIDVFIDCKPLEISPNFFLHYRTICFNVAETNVYLEHAHIYDLGWVPGDEWTKRWLSGSRTAFGTDIIENIFTLWDIFQGGGEDYQVRLLRTGTHLPSSLYASQEARRIAMANQYDWVIFGHFHSPTIEEIGNGKVYANPGDSLQHGNYIVLTPGQLRLGDWREIMRVCGGSDGIG